MAKTKRSVNVTRYAEKCHVCTRRCRLPPNDFRHRLARPAKIVECFSPSKGLYELSHALAQSPDFLSLKVTISLSEGGEKTEQRR